MFLFTIISVSWLSLSWNAASVLSFAPVSTFTTRTRHSFIVNQQDKSSSTTTSLFAIGILKRKAKEASLKEYIQNGVEDHVMEKYQRLKEQNLETIDLRAHRRDAPKGPLQEQLHRRKGTLTVIAEFKRKNAAIGMIPDLFAPELLSPTFREFGASGIAVLADEKIGGCTYDDLAQFVEEQRRARSEVPGPVTVINNDLIIDELQVARTAAYGAGACVVTLGVVGPEQCELLLRAAVALDLEAIVAVSSAEEAQTAIDLGARMINVVGVEGVDDKVAIVEGLNIPEGEIVTVIASILVKKDKNVQEIEEAWALRDKGFNCAWVGDVLYKAGTDSTETPGSIIKSMKSKSSLKWASPKVYTGRGEGAREYLGDILM